MALISKKKEKSAKACLNKCKKTTKPKKCCAMNWHKKKGCYLLSSYKTIQTKKGWTAGYVADSPAPSPSPSPSGTCKAKISKNKAYKYEKSALISKPTKTKNVQDCLKSCTGDCVAVNWKKKKCYRLSSVTGLKKKKGWIAAECA